MSIAVTGWRRTIKTGGSQYPQKTKRSMPPSGETSSNMVRNVAELRRTNLMHDTGDAKDKIFTVFHSAAEEADTKRENHAMKREEQSWDNEGGHMSSTAGRVTRVSSADLPYVVILAHHDSAATEHGFATMREAEAFIKAQHASARRGSFHNVRSSGVRLPRVAD